MQFPERLIQLRTQRGLSQEELAEALNVSRQTIGKWENGQVQPELPGLLAISRFFAISLDALVKGGCCELSAPAISPDADFVAFLLSAKRSTYAAHAPEGTSCRPGSHDLSYAEGSMSYLDSYFGGNSFHGQETVWESGGAIWCMNYSGRTLAPTFSGDFLKLALQRGTPDAPYRGPQFFQQDGYTYVCQNQGSIEWFSGTEAIFFGEQLVYECRFHGGWVR